MMRYIETLKTRINGGRWYRESVNAGFQPLDNRQYDRFNRFRPEGAKPLFCYLPFNSLTFSFSGKVFVCGYNKDVELGRYPDNSIDEIWNGAEAETLRRHMLHNDLSYGCRHCKYFFDKGKFTNLRPLVFDKYYKNTDALFPTVFEFELSNVCNLECQMCIGEVSSSIRKNRDKLPPIQSPYDDAFVSQLEKYIPYLKEAKFYGGEPFLIPIYYEIWAKIKELNPKLDLFAITNGSQWNDKIRTLLEDLNFELAVSIDAVEKEKVERIRKNVVFEDLLKHIGYFSSACNKKGKYLTLSYTVQKDNWDQFPRVLDLCNEVNAYIYVSYLERPTQFAVTDLPKDELKKIREYLERFSFPKFSSREKHNHKCFEDYKQFLDAYISEAETRKYHDYAFRPSGSAVKKSNSTSAESHVNPISFTDFIRWIDNQYASSEAFSESLPKELMIQKLSEALKEFTNAEKEIIYGYITLTPFNTVITGLKQYSTNDLRKEIEFSISKYF